MNRGQSNVTEVPLTGDVLGEQGQTGEQRRKRYGFMPRVLQPPGPIVTPKDDINTGSSVHVFFYFKSELGHLTEIYRDIC